MDDVLAAIDADALAATLEIGTAGFVTTLVTITLNDPSGSVAGDVLTFDPVGLTAVAAATGTAEAARLKDAAGTIDLACLSARPAGPANIRRAHVRGSGGRYEVSAA